VQAEVLKPLKKDELSRTNTYFVEHSSAQPVCVPRTLSALSAAAFTTNLTVTLNCCVAHYV
jgi:hypothetical protein